MLLFAHSPLPSSDEFSRRAPCPVASQTHTASLPFLLQFAFLEIESSAHIVVPPLSFLWTPGLLKKWRDPLCICCMIRYEMKLSGYREADYPVATVRDFHQALSHIDEIVQSLLGAGIAVDDPMKAVYGVLAQLHAQLNKAISPQLYLHFVSLPTAKLYQRLSLETSQRSDGFLSQLANATRLQPLPKSAPVTEFFDVIRGTIVQLSSLPNGRINQCCFCQIRCVSDFYVPADGKQPNFRMSKWMTCPLCQIGKWNRIDLNLYHFSIIKK